MRHIKHHRRNKLQPTRKMKRQTYYVSRVFLNFPPHKIHNNNNNYPKTIIALQGVNESRTLERVYCGGGVFPLWVLIALAYHVTSRTSLSRLLEILSEVHFPSASKTLLTFGMVTVNGVENIPSSLMNGRSTKGTRHPPKSPKNWLKSIWICTDLKHFLTHKTIMIPYTPMFLCGKLKMHFLPFSWSYDHVTKIKCAFLHVRLDHKSRLSMQHSERLHEYYI